MSARVASPTRAAALTRILSQVSCFPELRFDARPAVAGKGNNRSAGDAVGGLASAIEQATLRHWLTAESIARVLCTRPWLEVQPEIRAALLTGITQLYFMPREPDHAVVDDAVSWTRGRLQSGAGGFVNALLRRVVGLRGEVVAPEANFPWWDHSDAIPLPDGSVLKLKESIFSSDPLIRLSAQTSHPIALISRWATMRGLEVTRKLAAHGLLQAPLVVREAAGGEIPADHPLRLHSTPHCAEGCFIWNDSTEELAAMMARYPTLLVQDPASARAIEATRSSSPRKILDACAGRGTKAMQCALMHPDAEVWATDPDPRRLESLRSRAIGTANLKVVELHELGTMARYFDMLLLDLPCSNTGVLARRLEARYRFSQRTLDELAKLQRGIADHHRGLCAAKAKVIWSTCSLDRSENQDQAKWFARQTGGRIEHEDEWIPRGMPGEPSTTWTDGSYHATIALP